MPDKPKLTVEEQWLEYQKLMEEYMAKEAKLPGVTGGVLGAITQFFTAWIPAAAKGIAGVFPKLLSDFSAYWKESVKKDMETGIKPFIMDMISRREIPPELANYIKELIEKAGDFGVFAWAAILFSVYLGDFKGWLAVAMENGDQTLRAKARNTLPDPSAMIKAMFVDPANESKARDVIQRFGISDDRMNMMIAAARSQLDPGTIQNLYLRGELTDAEVYARMRAVGFTDARTDEIKKTWAVIPGPQDIIRMAVREAFSEEQVTALGLDEAFPAAVSEWAAKVGLKDPWPKMFWRAHWELPSPNMGFEMLHRGQITEAELGGLLKALDYSPVWHNKLQAIAYNVVTRVDARRLFQLGIYTPEQLESKYREMGYSPGDAADLTAWTKVEYAQEDKEVSRTTVESAYRSGLLNRREAVSMIKDLGWSEEKAEWILDLADFRALSEARDQSIGTAKELYLAGLASGSEVRERLSGEQVQADYIEALIDRWDAEKLARRKLPSKTDLDKFLKAGLVVEGEYKSELERLGYSREMADRYYKLNTKEQA